MIGLGCIVAAGGLWASAWGPLWRARGGAREAWVAGLALWGFALTLALVNWGQEIASLAHFLD
jgi:hypothetical protein